VTTLFAAVHESQLAHRDRASKIRVRNALKADMPQPTRMTVRPKGANDQ